MTDAWLTGWLNHVGGPACCRIWGAARRERRWRVISVFATHRRDRNSPWPLWRGTCITWTSAVIVVGWDFAQQLWREQQLRPASREYPVTVAAGRLGDADRRRAAGAPALPTASEVLAHECGHTWQALRLGPAYLPVVGSVTLFREGPWPWNYFENLASEEGVFGGLVNGSVCRRLAQDPEPDARPVE